VAATARLLTGWTVNPATGQFVFNPATHDTARVTAVGWTRPATGSAVSHGVAFLTHLARHPATARMVATKVARRFATDRPSPALVEDLAATYLANDTAIIPVLRTLFNHPEFARSTNTKFRRPLDWLVAAARATGATVTAATGVRVTQLGTTAQALGQVPFGWPAPNGYPDVEGAWMNAGALLARWNVAGDLVAGRVPLVNVAVGTLRAGLLNQPTDAAVTTLANRVVHEPLTKVGRDVVVEHTGLAGVTRLSSAQVTQLVNRVVPLLLATPDFQYR
jgi:uncharacterized protein (DUF1800 family)